MIAYTYRIDEKIDAHTRVLQCEREAKFHAIKKKRTIDNAITKYYKFIVFLVVYYNLAKGT